MEKSVTFMIFQFLMVSTFVEGSQGVVRYNGMLNSTINVEAISIFPFTVTVDKSSEIFFSYSALDTSNASVASVLSNVYLKAALGDDSMAEIKGNFTFHLDTLLMSENFSINVEGKLPGRVTLFISIVEQTAGGQPLTVHGSEETLGQFPFKLLIEREERGIDKAFTIVVVFLVVIANIGMGCKVDLEVVKTELKRPIAPVIGLCSQFIIMPLIAFAFAYNLDLDPGIALGFFALGCSPGGSASNAYTHFLGGSVSLSVTMTLVSTIAALGLLPMWLFTLGQLVYKDGDVTIPFQNIVFSLIGIVVPVVIGLFLQRKFPKVAELAVKIVKYVMILFIIFVLTVGIYANVYIFYLVDGEVLLSAALLPYLGFIFGGIAAVVVGQKKPNIIAIAVETGIQNTGIPIVLLQVSLSGPDKDTAIVSPVISALFTPLPLVAIIIYVQGKAYLKRKREAGKRKAGDAYIDDGHEDVAGSSDEFLQKTTPA